MRGRYRDTAFDAWATCCGPNFFAFARPRGRGGRVFARGDLKYIILELLAEGPLHGYEVMRRLSEESGGCYSPSPGSVYPTLQMLEDQGYVVSERVDGKRIYRITDAGQAFRAEHSRRVHDIVDRVADFSERFTGSGMRDVTRSFVRLAQVSCERAMKRAGDPDAMNRLREILDRAVRDMEADSADEGAPNPA
ncbi:MAG: PadR family transcriptional regulator [Gemmatimonadota bacterium]